MYIYIVHIYIYCIYINSAYRQYIVYIYSIYIYKVYIYMFTVYILYIYILYIYILYIYMLYLYILYKYIYIYQWYIITIDAFCWHWCRIEGCSSGTSCGWYKPSNQMCLHQSFNPESNPTEVVDFTHHAPQHGSFFQDRFFFSGSRHWCWRCT